MVKNLSTKLAQSISKRKVNKYRKLHFKSKPYDLSLN